MKLYTGLFIAALMAAPQIVFANQVIREANAKVAVIKTTYTKVNGRYQKSETKICNKQVIVPVRDLRQPGNPPATYWGDVQCESTIQNKPVFINTTVQLFLAIGNSPWEEGKALELKGMSTNSYVYAKNADVPADLIQDSLFMNSFTEDLNLKTMAFELVPYIQHGRKSICANEKGKPASPCKEEDLVSFEEFFSVYIFVEDKN